MVDTRTAAEDEQDDCEDDEDEKGDDSSPEQPASPAGLPPTSRKSADGGRSKLTKIVSVLKRSTPWADDGYIDISSIVCYFWLCLTPPPEGKEENKKATN